METGIANQTKIEALCGDTLELPLDAKIIPGTGGVYYIDESGNVYSFSKSNPKGLKLTNILNSAGYYVVNITFDGKRRPIEVHQLMARTFLQEDYIEKGLVCLHADDVKTNIKLTNLSIGTYSKNNKDAYATGVNQGNILGINN